MKKALRKLYDEEYKPEEDRQGNVPELELDSLDEYLEDAVPAEKVVEDQFKHYLLVNRLAQGHFNLLR